VYNQPKPASTRSGKKRMGGVERRTTEKGGTMTNKTFVDEILGLEGRNRLGGKRRGGGGGSSDHTKSGIVLPGQKKNEKNP